MRFEPVDLAAGPPPLAPGAVHVWRAHLPSLRHGLPLDALSQDERERAARLRLPAHRIAWQQARALQRAVLAAYLGREPAALRFGVQDAGGKPVLLLDAGSGFRKGEPLAFNLSHSGEAVLLAVADAPGVGVDVEAMREPLSDDLLAQACLGPTEQAVWRRLPPHLRATALLQAWTRKEAWLKAGGEGLRTDPREVEVPWLGTRATRAYVHGGTTGSIRDLPLGPGYVASLALRRPTSGCRGMCLGWPLDPRGLG